jgi:hypothetical protein
MTQNRLEYIFKQMLKQGTHSDPCFVYDKHTYYYKKSKFKRIPVVGWNLKNKIIYLMNYPFWK